MSPLKTYTVKYHDHEGNGWTGQSMARDTRTAILSFYELNPEARRIVSCVPTPQWS